MSKYERKAQSQRKHGPLSISGASKAPITPPVNRPGWKGPGYVKKQPARQSALTSNQASSIVNQLLPVELQQLVLDIFRDTFPSSQDFETLKPTLREVNDALMRRDFESAFGKEEYLEGYAVRWSPSRSLAYANVLAWICDQRRTDDWVDRLFHHKAMEESNSGDSKVASVVCFGGGAAEVMAFAALLRHLRSDSAGKPDQCQSSQVESTEAPDGVPSFLAQPTSMSTLLDLRLVDAADWSPVLSKLQARLTTPATLSKYASAVARASNAAFLNTKALNTTYTQSNIFELTTEDLRTMIGPDPTMITLLLTLNELYLTSIPKTTTFLRKLTVVAPKGTFLLVVDSPGAISETVVTSTEESQSTEDRKSFHMHWLMDRVLLEKTKHEETTEPTSSWEKVTEESCKHHKLEAKLRYTAGLENLKLQVHLFKRA